MGPARHGGGRTMTARRDLKRRARTRQRHSGESYTAALAAVRRGADGDRAIPAVVLQQADVQAAAAGLRCEARVTPGLWARCPRRARAQRLTAIFAELRAALATPRDFA